MLTRIGAIQPHINDRISIAGPLGENAHHLEGGLLPQPCNKELSGVGESIEENKTEKRKQN